MTWAHRLKRVFGLDVNTPRVVGKGEDGDLMLSMRGFEAVALHVCRSLDGVNPQRKLPNKGGLDFLSLEIDTLFLEIVDAPRALVVPNDHSCSPRCP